MNRRTFLGAIPAGAILPAILRAGGVHEMFPGGEDDEALCTKKFAFAADAHLRTQPIGDVIVAVGKTFLGTDYVANVLEMPGDEHLVVNMHGLDCVTFYENSLVLARCIKKNKTTFEDYKAELQFVRYRGGVIDHYPSRLHYTSDYFYDCEKKKVLRNITKEIGGVPFAKKVGFMSSHPESYPQLKEHPEFVKIIRAQEEAINARQGYYLPKEAVAEHDAQIQSGDILGITTSMEGLDTSHTGVAIRKDGRIHFMHAPITGAKVTITEKTLAEYLAGNRKQTGLIVTRPLEPV